MSLIDLTIVFEEVEEGWVQARIAEMPEVITAGRDRAEAKDLVLDALREYLLSKAAGPVDSAADQEALSLEVRAAG